MNTEVAVQAQKPAFDLSPQTFEQALTFANYLAESELVPKNFRGKKGDCLIAMQWGYDIGLKPLQALQNISVINGKPGLYGDAGKAILLAGGCIIDEDDTEIVKRNGRARCKVIRPGRPPVERTYSIDDAKTARLWGKEGPWSTAPYRQMAWRAFWFAARDAASDLLKGLSGAEEAIDLPEQTGLKVIDPATGEIKPEKGYWPDDAFAKKLPQFRKALEGGKTADEVIAWAQTKGQLTDAQLAEIRKPVTPATAVPAADAPTVTAAEIEAGMRAAKTVDALNEAAGLLNAITDDAQRKPLETLYDELAAKFSNAD